jgi:hypothetical protein
MSEIIRPSTAEVSEYSALNMLQYAITMATLKKTNYQFKVDIPYENLAISCGISEHDALQYLGSALRVSVSLKWDEDEEEMEISND